MKTVRLGLCELDSVCELGYYNDSKNNFEKIYLEENTIYFFFTEGANFNCKLVLDEYKDFNFIEINGKEIKHNDGISEVFLSTRKNQENQEIEEFYDLLIREYNFLPSYRQGHICDIYVDNISFINEDFDHLYLTNEFLHILGNSEASLKEISENQYEEHQFDKIYKIGITSIKEFDILVIKDNIYVSIFLDNGGVISFKDNGFSRDSIIKLKRDIKSLQYQV